MVSNEVNVENSITRTMPAGHGGTEGYSVTSSRVEQTTYTEKVSKNIVDTSFLKKAHRKS